MAEKVKKGDHVQIGFGKVHWVVEHEPAPILNDPPFWEFRLRSGMTDRRRTEVCRMGEITIIQKGQP